jgi:hypothetical protein
MILPGYLLDAFRGMAEIYDKRQLTPQASLIGNQPREPEHFLFRNLFSCGEGVGSTLSTTWRSVSLAWNS